MPGWLHRKNMIAVAGCALTLVIAGLGCGGSDNNGPNGPEKIPDFTLRDVNENSATFEQDVTFHVSSADTAVVLYFGRATCDGCRGQYAGVDTLVAELLAEGLAVTGGMVNHPVDAPYSYWLKDVYASLPALQDTLIVVGSDNVPALGHLLDCLESDELLIIDPDGYEAKKTKIGSGHELDLKKAADRETIKEWVRQAM